MIITCESCKVSYMVPANAVGANGRNVKCAKCGHVWFAKPKEEELELTETVAAPAVEKTEKAKPIPTGSSLPVIVDNDIPIFIRIAPYCLAVILICSFSFFYSNIVAKALPFTKGMFKSMGMYNTKHTVLTDMTFKQTVDNGKNNVTIKGKLVNLENYPAAYPIVRIQIRNHDNHVLAYHDIRHDNQFLGPHQFMPVDAAITNLPVEAEYLTVDVSDKVGLIFR